MNPMPELTPMLKQLRLSGILDSLESRNRQAIEEKFSHMDFLATILQDEIARRTQKRFASALRRANFRNQKTLEEFDFTFNPNINHALVLDLASCRFLQEKVCVFVVGPCGTGKSHIAQALGHAAIRVGYDVLFTTQSKMLNQLQAARATNSYDRHFAKLAAVDLLIIDDFGLKPLKTSRMRIFMRWWPSATSEEARLSLPTWIFRNGWTPSPTGSWVPPPSIGSGTEPIKSSWKAKAIALPRAKNAKTNGPKIREKRHRKRR